MDLQRYLRIPYLDRGLTEDGADCWGFARLVLQRETGAELPDFLDVEDLAGLEVALRRFREIPAPQDYDLVLMYSPSRWLTHVGVYYRGGVLHMSRQGAGYVPVDRLGTRIIGVYRAEKPYDSLQV